MATLNIEQIEQIIEPIINSINVELVDIEYRIENQDQMLRVFIDREEGVTLELCTDVTRLVKKVLDENDITYDHFEVSSPGLDRIIKREKNPQRFIGQQVKVKTLKSYTPKNIVGVLNQVNNDSITVENNTDSYNIPWDVITIIRLHPEFV